MGDWNIHIDGGETTVGDGTADSTGKGESGVESEARLLLGGLSLDVLDDGVDLGGSGRGSHFEGWLFRRQRTEGRLFGGVKRERKKGGKPFWCLRFEVFFFFSGAGAASSGRLG